MTTAAAKGSYYKLRTKRWLEAHGFAVAFMERIHWIPARTPGGRMIPIKRDQFGADLLAMSRDALILVQVKGGTARGHRAAGRREFDKFPIPPFVRTWIVSWQPHARAPEIQDYVTSDRDPKVRTDGEATTGE
jgi:hypothetical protein